MIFNTLSFILLFVSRVQSAPVQEIVVPLAPLDCFSNVESAPARAARLTAWVAATAAAQTFDTVALVAETLEEANYRFANGYTDATEREAERVLAVTVAAAAAAKAVSAAAYGTRMVAGLELVLPEVCSNLVSEVVPEVVPEVPEFTSYSTGIKGRIIISIDDSGALHFRVYLKDIQKGLHSFNIHDAGCDPMLYNPNFSDDFVQLDADYRHEIHNEFSTNVRQLPLTNGTSLQDRLEAEDISIIIHVNGQEYCGEMNQKYGVDKMRKYRFQFM